MVETLDAGMHLMLPSGNVVILRRPEGREWVCEYTELARARGEVVFAEAFLKAWARQV